MLFQLYPLPNLNPHHPQFITKSYGTSCLYAQTQTTEAQLTLCKGITFSDYLLHSYTNYNLGQTHRHKFRRLVPLAGCACILRDEFTKIYALSHKMSFIHVHIIQRPKAIHVYSYKIVEEPVKAKKCTISSIYLLFANIKKTLIDAWVERYGSDLTGHLRLYMYC